LDGSGAGRLRGARGPRDDPGRRPRAIREKAGFDTKRIAEIEAEVRHDVIAFLTSVSEKVGPPARHIHYGLTSSDVLDTALALTLVRAADLILADLGRMMAVLKRRALEHRRTVMVGRTHGIHAEPYTLGLKLAGWYAEAARNRERLGSAREEICHGKISGRWGPTPTSVPRSRPRCSSGSGSTPSRFPPRSFPATGTPPTSRRWP